MTEFFVPRSLHHAELFLIHYGFEDCEPRHHYGPAVRDHYLFHFVTQGQGIFHVGGHTYTLGEGQGFMIYPDTVTYYEADNATPWSYVWVGFNGLLAETLLHRAGLSAETPTIDCGTDRTVEQCIMSMIRTAPYARAGDIRLTGLLYEFMAALIEHHPQPTVEKKPQLEEYVEKVLRFIELNYANKITVTDIARTIGLNRSYLNTLFRRQLHTSIQDYLIRYRLQRACQLMLIEKLTIGDISRSVGYEDPLHFSKIFKKVYGLPPRVYREKLLSQETATTIDIDMALDDHVDR